MKKLTSIIFAVLMLVSINSFAQTKQDCTKTKKCEKKSEKCMKEMSDSCKGHMKCDKHMKDTDKCMNKKCDHSKMDHDKMMKEHKGMDHDKMMKNMDHKGMMHGQMGNHMKMDDIVRKGEIDLKAIDKNNDGKVFQDVMDWNVISDTPGTCPVCEMKLKEVTLDQAKDNLIKHGFKVK